MGQEAETPEAPAAIQEAETKSLPPALKERVAKYIVIDTETSDKPDFKLPADAPGQARLAEFAMVLLDDELQIIDTAQIYIKPDGWSMQPEAAAVNGLTDEFLKQNGKPVSVALDMYARAISEGCVVVAHNAQFDAKILRGEFRRANRHDWFEQTKQTCTMRSMQQWLKSQGRPAKWIKLSEAAAIAGYTPTGAHAGMADVMTCVEVFRFLSERGVMNEPQVHYGFGSAGGVDRRAAEE